MPNRACSWRPFLQVGLAFTWLLAASTAWGQEQPEYRLKAAILYNFATFTEWPGGTGTTLNLCVYGLDPFAAEIDSLTGKTAGSSRIEVQRKTTVDALKSCQVVFIATASIGQLPRVLAAVQGLPVLIVADTPGSIRQGVMLNMTLAEGRVSFEANLSAARNARLSLSSKMLRLATEVIQ